MKNQRGFAAFEILILVLLLGVLGFVGYRYWKANQETDVNQAPSSIQTKSTKLVKFTSKIDGFSLMYPSDWNVEENKVSKLEQTGNPQERFVLKSPRGLKLNLWVTDASGFGGGCPDDNYIFQIDSLSVPGGTDRYIGIEGVNKSSGSYARSFGVMGGYEGMKVGQGCITYYVTNAKKANYEIWLNAAYHTGDGLKEVPLEEFKSDKDVKAARKIFESISYQ